WPTNVAELLNTPRTLKAVLRSVVDSWEHLHGEVDFDELLIVTTLRYSAGPVFSFLVRRFADLQVFSAVGRMLNKKRNGRRSLMNYETIGKTQSNNVMVIQARSNGLCRTPFPPEVL